MNTLVALLIVVSLTRPVTLAIFSSNQINLGQANQTVTATWSPNPVADNVITYTLFYGIAPATYTLGPISVAAPLTTIVIPNLIPGTTYYFALQAISAAGKSPLSTEVSYTIPQINNCLDVNGNSTIQLRVLDYTPSLAAGGLGRLLWTITSVNKIINITATLAANSVTTPISVINGADSKTLDLSRSAGVNFNAPTTSGNYTLVVSATDINGCKVDTSSVNRIVNVP